MSLNKNAATFTPKFLSAAGSSPAPAAPPAAATHVDPTARQPAAQPSSVPVIPASSSKLSGGASSFVPRSQRGPDAASAAAAPAAAAASPTPAPKPSAGLGALPPRAPQGAWGKRPPAAVASKKVVTPQAKPVSPAVKPRTPMSTPSTPGARPATPGEKYKVPEKKLTEAMIAAKAEKLNKGAAVYIPKKFVPKLNMVTPPISPGQLPVKSASAAVPKMDMQADPDALMPLTRKWSLYFVDRAPQGQAAYDPTLVYEIKSVEDFWRTVNNVPTLTHGNLGSTYYFFRDNIHPKWEDEGNQGGGAWTVRLFASRDLTSEAIDEIWERLLCRAIGESWPASLAGNLVGLVAKMRDRATTIQFWVSGRSDEFPAEVMATIGSLYKAFNMDYVSHQEAKVAAEERDKAAALKDKDSKKKKKRH